MQVIYSVRTSEGSFETYSTAEAASFRERADAEAHAAELNERHVDERIYEGEHEFEATVVASAFYAPGERPELVEAIFLSGNINVEGELVESGHGVPAMQWDYFLIHDAHIGRYERVKRGKTRVSYSFHLWTTAERADAQVAEICAKIKRGELSS